MTNEAIVKRNRRAGFMILAAVLLPMLIAYIIFKSGLLVSGKGKSNGIIISPVKAISELEITEGDTLASLYQPGEDKRWRILVPVTLPCLEECAKRLYLSRQAHIALGQKSRRVERILLFLQSPTTELLNTLVQDHPNTLHVSSSRGALDTLLNGSLSKTTATLDNNVYLIDQEGWLMMAYLPSHTGNDMLGDIKKLLRLSYEQ